ncbi:hypothetical protein AB5J72_22545 [Streptomyces sp. CG1]|uniref:hypothetical protein n=1 Tax=Streptomyces sp. CG1 TaxID=1287523 RepID=UPI0034E23C8A
MRIRGIIAAAVATAALAGLGITGATTAQAATPQVSGHQCTAGGGFISGTPQNGFFCVGGKYAGQPID